MTPERPSKQLRIVRMGLAVMLALTSLGCDNNVEVEPGSGSPGAGGGSGTSTAAGSSGTTAPGGAGTGGTSTGGNGTAGDGTTSTTSTTSTTVDPPECVIHDDCMQASKPKCDPETGECVPCLLAADDNCPDGKYCAKASFGYTCMQGCKSDADCNAGPEPDVFTCKPVAHQCLGCSADEHCPPGSICDAAENQCKPGCSDQKPCPASDKPDCCGSTCVKLLADMSNCGTCGAVCEVDLPNAEGVCSLGACKLSCNVIGKVDCNKVVGDGCEVDVNTDPSNCGGCGNLCASGQSCVGGGCQ